MTNQVQSSSLPRHYRLTLFSFLIPSSFIALLISYLVDSSRTIWYFNLIYGEPLTLNTILLITLTFLLSYLILEFFLWIFYELHFYINLRWATWGLIFHNLLWLTVPIQSLLENLGLSYFEYPVLLIFSNHPFVAPFILYLLSIALFHVLKFLNIDIREIIPIFPRDLDPMDGVLSIFSVFFIKFLLSYFI